MAYHLASIPPGVYWAMLLMSSTLVSRSLTRPAGRLAITLAKER